MTDKRFDVAMEGLYRQAVLKCKYRANYFLQMLHANGGLETARQLLRGPDGHEGFVKLWECGCLGLSVEALVLKPEWHDLFTDEERDIARRRLKEYGYAP